MAVELRALRHFVTLCELGSFAKAASALELSQPALTRSIQALERQVGGQLVFRSSAGAVPTDIGRLLAQRAREVLQLSDDLGRDLLLKRTLQSGHVAVGAGPYPAETVFGPALSRLIDEHSTVKVSLQVRAWDELLVRLRNREIDFFVAETSTMAREADVEIEPLGEHPIYFVARCGHPLAGLSNITLEEVFVYPVATMSRVPPRILQPILAAQRRAGEANRPFPAIENATLASIKHMLHNSKLVSAIQLPCIGDELKAGTLTALATEPWLQLSYGVVTLKGRPMSPTAQRLRELIVAEEQAVTTLEQQLIKRWAPGATARPVRRPRPQRRASTRSV